MVRFGGAAASAVVVEGNEDARGGGFGACGVPRKTLQCVERH